MATGRRSCKGNGAESGGKRRLRKGYQRRGDECDEKRHAKSGDERRGDEERKDAWL